MIQCFNELFTLYQNSVIITCCTSLVKWREDQAAVEEQGVKILDALMRGTAIRASVGQCPPAAEVATTCYNMLEQAYDADKGGFSKAPKFPQPGLLHF